MRRLGAVLAFLTALALAGCSEDTSGTGTPEPTGSVAPEPSGPETTSPEDPGSGDATAGDDPCAMLGARRLSEITGRALTVTDAQQQGRLVQCNSVAAADEPLSVEWRMGEAVAPFDTLVATESLGLEPRRVELTGGVRAAVVQGEVAGIPVGKVITVAGGQQVVVEARLLGLDKAASDLDPADLTRIATEVAETYVVGSGV